MIKKSKIKSSPKGKKVHKQSARAVKKKTLRQKKQKKKLILIHPLDRKISKARELDLIAAPEIVDFIKKIAGDEGYMLYEELCRVGKMIDEYSLAEKAKLQINYVRSLLYKLYDHKLVVFRRDRDKKKGWFIYSWCARPEKLKYTLITKKMQEVAKLKLMLQQKEDKFFCKACDKDCEYTKAIETMFFCDCCGGHLEAINSASVKENIQKQIDAIEKEIALIKEI